jgi:Sucrase/ferredoxin-like
VAESFDGRVLLIRRPDRRDETGYAYVAEVTPEGGALYRGTSPDSEQRETGPLVLVCAHGRRDPCCARLGPPVYDALARELGGESVWHSSHHGGHRFAANVLVLPGGIQLGRVPPDDAALVATAIHEGRIPLPYYRGRTLDPPRAQAADATVRMTLSLDGIGDVRMLRDEEGIVELAVPAGVARVRVDEVPGPELPPSCGAASEATVRFETDVLSLP